ncbi:MAG: lysine--tRNA ligase, partial [Planctomycetes bacterium]|nr:lysine--tRNA ligase [Planctomycetota bacterium]
MEETNELILQRIKKLNELRSLGINPYSNTFKVTDSSKTIIENYGSLSAEELETRKIRCTLAGRIVALRSFGKAAFAHLQDGKGRIQIYVKKEVIGEEAFFVFKNIDIGDFIGAEGVLF